MLLFGGPEHKAFLGCLNCGAYNETSVCNQYGEFGSQYKPDSIWNAYGTYGSKYNPYSPWNAYSTTPPIIVDEAGHSYGYFTVNKCHGDRTRIDWLVKVLDVYTETGDLDLAREQLCAR